MAKKKKSNGAKLGYEEKLWQMADKMRGHMDSSEYKHVVLGLIFLKYISDAFQDKFDALKATQESEYTDPEDRDEYKAENIFWVVPEARWDFIDKHAMSGHTDESGKIRNIGKIIDDAMYAIEKENPALKNVLPKNFSRPSLDKHRLGELVGTVSTIDMKAKESDVKDPLGRVYEYFLGRFAAAEGKGGGEFYTPQCVVQLLVDMLEPTKGRVFDPCCGSGGMFVQSEKFIEAHAGKLGDIAVYGQESNPTTWKLAKMNLAIRGIDANLGKQHADSFLNDQHKDIQADYILANPPFNMSDWGGDRLKQDVRWKHGIPPANNANYAWIQHFLHHLKPTGTAGFVMANGSMSTSTNTEGEIRKQFVEKDLVDCMVALPGQLFYTTQIPVCLWFLTRNKKKDGQHANRQNKTLFIDARRMGTMVDRVHRELTPEDLQTISDIYHNWRNGSKDYEDKAGWWKSASTEEIAKHDYVLTPGRYVGAEEVEDDGVPFEEKMKVLSAELREQFKKSDKLEAAIKKNLKSLGF